jgi:hypothetical protein
MRPITYAYAADIVKTERDDDGHLVVYGKATGPDLDLDGQICDPSWLKSAMPAWMEWGNVREMHQPIAAGVGVELEAKGDDWWLKSVCVDPNTAAKIEAGVLKGYSIGINSAKVIKDAAAPGGRIVGGYVVETSYVDRPCNPTAKMAVCKMVGGQLVPVEAAEAETIGADSQTIRRYLDAVDGLRPLLPNLDKAAATQDIADAQAAIAAIARIIVSEADSLAAGQIGDAYQISCLLDAVSALRWFICCEEEEASMGAMAVELGVKPEEIKAALIKLGAPTKAAPPADPTSGTSQVPASTTDLETLVKAAVAEATAPLVERSKALEAELAKVKAQPVPGGPVLARPVQDIAKANQREQLIATAQQYEGMARELRPSDPTAASGYAQKAAALRAELAAL